MVYTRNFIYLDTFSFLKVTNFEKWLILKFVAENFLTGTFKVIEILIFGIKNFVTIEIRLIKTAIFVIKFLLGHTL